MRSLKQSFVWPLVAAIAIASGSYFGAAGLTHALPAFGQAPAVQPVSAETAKPTPTPQPEAVAPATDLARAFRVVHNSLKDAVVNINVTKKPTTTTGGRVQIPDELRGMLPPGFDPDQLNGQEPEIEGTGSGVIVNAEGYILTNNHVVSDASDITVALNDGRELKADLVGTDPKTDLAVVRIKADHLTFAKFGDSDALDVGDWVLAFGSPFGFSQTMTQGIISAKGRHVPIIASHNPALQGLTYENFLQTDAAINPGNSGGPLVNLRGEVVGINAAIASNTGAYNGIGFSIPSNDAQYIMKSLIEHGKVVRGYLGVMIEDMAHPADAHKGLVDNIRKQGYSAIGGVLIAEVTANSPGAAGGLQPGDVITAINGTNVNTSDEMRNQIARVAPDTKVNLSIFREGKAQQLSLAVGTQPDSLRTVAMNDNNKATPDAAAVPAKGLGIRVEDMSATEAKKYGLKADGGAVIAQVAPQSLGHDLGLKPGDVITKIDKTDVTNAKQLSDALASAKLSDGVKLLVRSDDGSDRLVYAERK